MENNSAFVAELNKITFKHGLSNYNQFNIFPVMFKMTEEKNLHSGFIALLYPKGAHGKGNIFLKSFLEEFEIYDFDIITTPISNLCRRD